MEKRIEFFVHGVPRPGGSKRPWQYKRKDGTTGIAMADVAGDRIKAWRSAVVDAAKAAYDGPPLAGPIRIEVVYLMPRPKCHYGTGNNAYNLKTSAPMEHTKQPDCLKLQRGTEDAMNKLIWRDDSQIVAFQISKTYTEGNVGAKIIIEAYEPE